jgi:predicted CoA-binding protein
MAAWTEPSEHEVAEIVRHARVVAVVGMKGMEEPFAPAHTVPAQMRRRGIRIIPVNPKMRETLSEHALGSVGELKEPPDIIQVFRKSEHLPGLAAEIVALPPAVRPKVVWMQTGIVNEAAAEKLEAAGIRVVMDRCFGVDMAKYR